MNARWRQSEGRESRPGDPLLKDLHDYAVSLSPDVAGLGRIRLRAQTEYRRQAPALAEVARRSTLRDTFIGRRVPLAVMAIALLAAAFGDIEMCAGLSAFGFGRYLGTAPAVFGAPFILTGLLVMITGMLGLLFAWGTWKHKAWAWTLGVAVQIASLVLSISWMLVGASVPLQALTAAVAVVILVGLDRAELRIAFGRPLGSRAGTFASH